VFAAKRTIEDFFYDILTPSILLPSAGVLLLLLVISYLIIRARSQSSLTHQSGTESLLTEFHELWKKGEISEEEYRSIRKTLSREVQERIATEEKAKKADSKDE